MSGGAETRIETLEELTRRPIRLDANPVHTFYEGGRLWRGFRGETNPSDSYRAEDWISSCIDSRTAAPDGSSQGLSTVGLPDGSRTTLRELFRQVPEPMLGAHSAGADPAFQVKLVSPAARVPLHAHPDADFAREHYGWGCGKTEAWILLATPGAGGRDAYAGYGFVEDVTPERFLEAVETQDKESLTSLVHEFPLRAGDVVLVPPGVPHYISGGTFFIEIQEPADLGVLAEWKGSVDSPESATGGIAFEDGVRCFELAPQSRRAALEAAFQRPTPADRQGPNTETNLLGTAAEPYFRATRLDVESVHEPSGRGYYVALCTGGTGWVEGGDWSEPLEPGDVFAMPATLEHRFRANSERLSIVCASGPGTA